MDHTSTVVVSTGNSVELLAIVTLLAIVAFVWVSRKAIKQFKRQVDTYADDATDLQRHRRVIEQQGNAQVSGQLAHWEAEESHWQTQEGYWEHQNLLADYLREHAFQQLQQFRVQQLTNQTPSITIALQAPTGHMVEAPIEALPPKDQRKLLKAADTAMLVGDTGGYEVAVAKAREWLDRNWMNQPAQLPSPRR